MQVHKCDECGKIGEPGETWVTVSVGQFYIPGNQAYYGDSPEVSGPNRNGSPVCSPACAVDRLREGLEDLLTYAEQMHEGVSVLGDELVAKAQASRDR